MKSHIRAVAREFRSLLLFLSVILPVSLTGADAPGQPAKPVAAARPAGIKFRPLTTNGPAVRVTGGSRGTDDLAVSLDVLAPDQTGLTTQAQPSLFWYQSRPSDAGFELTLLREGQPKPLMRLKQPHASAAGIQRIRLKEHGVTLEPGVDYQWVVALITDPENRSTDLVASGAIRRVAAPPVVAGAARGEGAAAAYAEAGLWYDALTAISDLVEASPKDPAPRRLRSDLLTQIGLKAAAAADASPASP